VHLRVNLPIGHSNCGQEMKLGRSKGRRGVNEPKSAQQDKNEREREDGRKEEVKGGRRARVGALWNARLASGRCR